ncbi:hypothetical protein KDD17_14440 [Sulfitobacter albidus]|uniref:Uncharacterized protein n=1 Tax=Sulfitobacter albidus TaxID=2829501 RepID=A0A975JD80_9RHOB|nr:hypothetical protein [Sulfitobacter albidus]QUJ76106.1 hypothetical protein KDD17_14440 [Sulfitobacter albidus]
MIALQTTPTAPRTIPPVDHIETDTDAWRDMLNAARMATFDHHLKPETPQPWLDELVSRTLTHEAANDPRTRKRRKTDAQAFREAVAAFAVDLVRESANEASQGFLYRPVCRAELKATFVSRTNFEVLTAYWEAMGWLEKVNHTYHYIDFDGEKTDLVDYAKAARYRATPAFLTLAADHGITPETVAQYFERSFKDSALVQVRESKGGNYLRPQKGKLVKWADHKIKPHLKQIQYLNTMMQEHNYSLTSPPAVRRLFNCSDREDFDLDLGGRLYAVSDDNWRNMPKAERAKITIDGCATVEVDVKASHLSILYALHGQTLVYRPDPYYLKGVPRWIVKGLVVAWMGRGKQPSRWPQKMIEEFHEKEGKKLGRVHRAKDIGAAMLARHPVLGELKPDVLDWANLQYEEAQCFIGAMMKLHEDSIPSLPVHDSLRVRVDDLERVSEVLKAEYRSRLGFVPVLEMNL